MVEADDGLGFGISRISFFGWTSIIFDTHLYSDLELKGSPIMRGPWSIPRSRNGKLPEEQRTQYGG